MRRLYSGLLVVGLAFVFGYLFGCPVHAQPLLTATVEVAWDANDPVDQVTGYVVEYGPAPAFTTTQDVGNVTSAKLLALPVGVPLNVRVYAYNERNGHQLSPPSAVVTVTPGVAGSPVCTALSGPGFSSAVTVIIQAYDQTARRSDPAGALARFEAGSAEPITRVEFALEGNGEPGVLVVFPVGVGFDGRYVRAVAFKPTINGIFPLVVVATDQTGRRGGTRCTPGITVGF